ncbi:MAG: isocitrate lyase/phosphoenolpyruvate mutase family protein [Dermatophilaceae bacterium]
MTAASSNHPVRAVGASSAIAARIAAEAGFTALWVSGLEVSSSLGLPDTNVLGVRDLTGVVVTLGRVVPLPVIVDVDNAGGSLASADRYAHDLLRAGAAALCLEDSTYPKVNSFRTDRGQSLAPVDLVAGQLDRMRAVVGRDAVLIARTEALIAGNDVPTALERAHLYAEAGADAVLIHSKDTTGAQPRSIAELWSGTVPLVTIPTAFSHLGWQELADLGFRMCIYANQLTRAAMAGMRDAALEFSVTGSFHSTMATPMATVGDVLAVADPTARACV